MTLVLHLFPIFSSFFYLAASFGFLAQLFWPQLLLKGSMLRASRLFVILGLVFHGIFLISGEWSASDKQILPTFPLTLSLISFALMGGFLAVERRLSIGVLGAFLSPIATAFMLSSGALFHVHWEHTPPESNRLLLWTHVGLAIFGHASFAFAFAVSIALILQETFLKRRRFSLLQQKLPSIQLLDSLNSYLLTCGFFLMLLGILAGFTFSFASNIKFPFSDSRVFWSLLALGIYSLVLVGRFSRGLRGRRAAWISVLGFCVVLCSFVGVRLVQGGFHVY